MPKYFYTAKSMEGETTSGTKEAKDERELGKILHQEGYILISANLEEEKKRGLRLNFSIGKKVSVVEKMMFTRNLQIMVSAGLPIPRALNLLAGQAKNKRFRSVLFEISEKILQGNRLSESMSKYQDIFSELFVNMIMIGEESGTLEDILKNLTHQMEREHQLKSRIKGAMMYPAVILCLMLGIGVLMLIAVIPKLAQMFNEMNVELPISTKIVMALGDFISKKWYLALIGTITFIVTFRTALRTKIGKRIMDIASLRIPIISSLVRQTNSAYTTRTLGSLFASGIPIVRALEITANSLGNLFFREALKDAAEKVGKGAKLGEALKPYENLYPSLVVQMIEIGEETGETSTILQKLADFYEEEVSEATKNLSSIIEPMLMIVIGAAVGFFAISIFQPMYGMLGNI